MAHPALLCTVGLHTACFVGLTSSGSVADPCTSGALVVGFSFSAGPCRPLLSVVIIGSSQHQAVDSGGSKLAHRDTTHRRATLRRAIPAACPTNTRPSCQWGTTTAASAAAAPATVPTMLAPGTKTAVPLAITPFGSAAANPRPTTCAPPPHRYAHSQRAPAPNWPLLSFWPCRVLRFTAARSLG